MTLNPWELNELANGSILHKRVGRLYELGQYEIIHFIQDGVQRRQYKVCSELDNSSLIVRFPNPLALELFRITTIISTICTGLHIFVYTTLKELRDVPAQIMLSLTVAAFPIQLVMIVGGLQYSKSRWICIFIGIALHYFQLVCAFWFNVASFDVCLAYLAKRSSNQQQSRMKMKFKIYSIYSWGIPALITTMAVVSEQVRLNLFSPTFKSLSSGFCMH